MTSRFLQLFRPISKIMPEVVKPEKKPTFNQKLMWTFVALILYLMLIKIPVYGPGQLTGEDPFRQFRIILASERGTLGELGIGPIVTAGMILQLLVGSKIISVNFNDPEERALYTSTQKIMAVVMTIFQAIAYIAGGAYGDEVQSNTPVQVVIVIQLVLAGVCIILLDELVQKGWGLGSGISLFIATSVSVTVFRGAFSFEEAGTLGLDPSGEEYVWRQGAIVWFIESIARNEVLTYGLYHPNSGTPDMVSVLATILVFAVVIYVESMKIEIPVQHADTRVPARYPIKFLYVSNIPVILVSALFANIFLIGNLMDNRFGDSMGPMGEISRFIGQWETINGQNVPVSGLAAFTTPPRGIHEVMLYPERAIGYLILMTVMSTVFAMIWVETAGMGSRDVARQLLGADMQIPGFRRHPKIVSKYLNNYIPYAAFLGGLFVGLLASIADFLGALGSGVGILLTTGILRQYYEILAKERLAEINPALAQLIGIT